MSEAILSVENVHISFQTYGVEVQAVRGVSFSLARGETLAIVGESGSGKSVTAKGIMRLLPKHNTRVFEGRITYAGRNILDFTAKELQRLRGAEISMVFQDPMTSLNPTLTIGKQIMEGIRQHQQVTWAEARQQAIEMLKLVGIPQAEERLGAYPHQFSGGMRQRVVIAMALACHPKVLIADEPTTALDVTIQAQILDLMKELQQKTGTAIMLITHDLGVVANMAHRVAVMYAGQIVEMGSIDEIFYDPRHPYTWGLLQSMPRLYADRSQALIPIAGTPPDQAHLPKGCPFAPRCPYVLKVCQQFPPQQTEVSQGHVVSCWLQDERAPRIEAPVGIGERA